MEYLTAADLLRAKPLLGANTPHSSRYVVLLEEEYRLILHALEEPAGRKVPRQTHRAAASDG